MKKNTFSGVLLSVLGCIGLMGITAPAAAQPQFSTSSSMDVGPDFNSGRANFWGSGEDLIPTGLSLGVSSRPDHYGDWVINTHMRITGVFGIATNENPYYDLLEQHGLTAADSYRMTGIEFNGEFIEFVDDVVINASVSMFLYRDDNHTEMYGHFFHFIDGLGAIPTSSYVTVQVYEEGHPDWLPDWEIEAGSTWPITAELVPTPGSLAIAGLALLKLARRRRSH